MQRASYKRVSADGYDMQCMFNPQSSDQSQEMNEPCSVALKRTEIIPASYVGHVDIIQAKALKAYPKSRFLFQRSDPQGGEACQFWAPCVASSASTTDLLKAQNKNQTSLSCSRGLRIGD